MTKQLTAVRKATEEEIISQTYLIRGQKVMLDKDLAEMYDVEVRVLNQAVKRNLKRFPERCMFQLTQDEMRNWKSQIVISNSVKMGLRKLPYAFTEHGVLALSFVLRSDRAIQVSDRILDVYVKMRQMLMENKDLQQHMDNIEHRMDKKDEEVQAIFTAFKAFMIQDEKPRPRIGFTLPTKKK